MLIHSQHKNNVLGDVREPIQPQLYKHQLLSVLFLQVIHFTTRGAAARGLLPLFQREI